MAHGACVARKVYHLLGGLLTPTSSPPAPLCSPTAHLRYNSHCHAPARGRSILHIITKASEQIFPTCYTSPQVAQLQNNYTTKSYEKKWRFVSVVSLKAPKLRKRSPFCFWENYGLKGILNHFGVCLLLPAKMLQNAMAVNVKMLLPECDGTSKLPLLHWISPCAKPLSLRQASEVHLPAVKTLLSLRATPMLH